MLSFEADIKLLLLELIQLFQMNSLNYSNHILI